MLSRVAESIYWMCRYVERAENVARFIDVNLNLILDVPLQQSAQWQPLVNTSGDYEDFEKRYGEATQDNVIRFLTFDQQNANSILSCLWAARENARSVRDVISSEMFEQVNRMYLMVRGAAAASGDALDSPHAFYAQTKLGSHLFVGITDATMSHGEAWHFAHLGRLFERADKTARILDVKYFILLPHVDYVGTPYDTILWSALLKSASALEMYRKKHQRIHPDLVTEFLVLDHEFPRSMHYCLTHSEESLRAITGSRAGTFNSLAEQRLGRLRADLNYARVEEIIKQGLHEYLDSFQLRLNAVGEAVHEGFFALRAVPGRKPAEQVQESIQ